MRVTLELFGALSFIGLALAGETAKVESGDRSWRNDPLYYPGVKIAAPNKASASFGGNVTYAEVWRSIDVDANNFNHQSMEFPPLFREYPTSACHDRWDQIYRGGYYYVTEERAYIKSCKAVPTLAENVGTEICCAWQGESCTYKKETSVSLSKGGSTKFGISIETGAGSFIAKTTATVSFEQEFRYDKTVTEVASMELKCPPGKCCRPQLAYLTLHCDYESRKQEFAFEKMDRKNNAWPYTKSDSGEYNSDVWHEDDRDRGHYVFDYLKSCKGAFIYSTYYNTMWESDTKWTDEGQKKTSLDPNTNPSTLYLRLRDGAEHEVGVKP
ncbi:hypothetical protein BGW38_001239 [Lunasporangiospora selenospora]|uniref:Uncharacterized protein n=1 Tax=Lunasporangiospora selenospora TaxID=979761 RepID=A0A9P6FU18_9FUNG|nr:hypothetical protein BGW38_001239 [Lunasporangiospora selenospora]